MFVDAVCCGPPLTAVVHCGRINPHEGWCLLAQEMRQGDFRKPIDNHFRSLHSAKDTTGFFQHGVAKRIAGIDADGKLPTFQFPDQSGIGLGQLAGFRVRTCWKNINRGNT